MTKQVLILIGMLPDYLAAWFSEKADDLRGTGINFKDREDA